MISYKDELKKYEPAILIEDMEDSIYSADFRDIFELMQYIVNSSKNKEAMFVRTAVLILYYIIKPGLYPTGFITRD